jgi:predicted nucleic acid-binding Zn ribbon protein
MAHHRRAPRPLTLALSPLERELAPESLLADVQRHWQAAVGALLAEHTLPVAERGGTLVVSCSAAVWAQELDLMSTQVIQALNAELGGVRVRRLKCTSKGL